MDTPIFDYVTEYCKSNPARFHMPGHKGVNSALGIEAMDITEIDGAGDLWHGNMEKPDIIAKSEANASEIFGCNTFYSTEGSSLAIRGMLFLIKKWSYIHGKKPLFLAGRNAHKSFVNTAALLDLPVEYIYGQSDRNNISCNISAKDIEEYLQNPENEKPVAMYITTPDYLGNMLDVKSIAEICHANDIFLLVDNAHGAYLKFVSCPAEGAASYHPMDLGADMCCDSAHKTLPALTGAAYLHISKDTEEFFIENARNSIGIFGSTSPSYLILQSLDLCNKYMAESLIPNMAQLIKRVSKVKSELGELGYSLYGDEILKITIDANAYGYKGEQIASELMKEEIYSEYYDDEYVVLMISAETSDEDFSRLMRCLKNIGKKESIGKIKDSNTAEKLNRSHNRKMNRKQALSPYEAILHDSEVIKVQESSGRILAEPVLSCPPCVPEYMAGEVIETVPEGCEYVRVIKNS